MLWFCLVRRSWTKVAFRGCVYVKKCQVSWLIKRQRHVKFISTRVCCDFTSAFNFLDRSRLESRVVYDFHRNKDTFVFSNYSTYGEVPQIIVHLPCLFNILWSMLVFLVPHFRVFGYFEKPLFIELCKHIETKFLPANTVLSSEGVVSNSYLVLETFEFNLYYYE